MIMKAYLVTAALAGATFVVACAGEPMNVESAHDAGRGSIAEFDAPIDQVWTAAHAAIRWASIGKPTDHQDKWYVVTDPAAADQVGIWLEPEGATKTRARIIVMDDPTLPGPDERDVKKDIGAALGLIAQGKPLDKRP
jgi:hypothetical protein